VSFWLGPIIGAFSIAVGIVIIEGIIKYYRQRKESIKPLIAGIITIIIGILTVLRMLVDTDFGKTISIFQSFLLLACFFGIIVGYSLMKKRNWIIGIFIIMIYIAFWIPEIIRSITAGQNGPLFYLIMGSIALISLIMSKNEFDEAKALGQKR